MPTPGQELSSIDFASMIGGPLVAVVNAQAQAAMSTVNFIKQIGFKPADNQQVDGQTSGEPIYVKFEYSKDVVAADGSTAPETHELKVPMLTIVPIPCLRIEETTIDFNAKINSVEYARTDTTVGVDAELEARAGWGWGSARLKVNASYKRTSVEGHSVERTYTLGVKVVAKQEELPEGMQRVLSILENSITSNKKAVA